MAKKSFTDTFDRVRGKQEESINTAVPETTEPKKRKRAKKYVEGIDYVTFTTRIDPKAQEFIRNYAYTKRITMKKAIDEIVFAFKDEYEANPKNEKLLKGERL